MQKRLSNASKELYDGENSVGREFLLICGFLLRFPEHANVKKCIEESRNPLAQ